MADIYWVLCSLTVKILSENSDICSREYLRLPGIRENNINWSSGIYQQCLRTTVIFFKLLHFKNLDMRLNSEN